MATILMKVGRNTKEDMGRSQKAQAMSTAMGMQTADMAKSEGTNMTISTVAVDTRRTTKKFTNKETQNMGKGAAITVAAPSSTAITTPTIVSFSFVTFIC